MKHLDLVDLVALAAEVSELEAPKLLELLDTPEIDALLAEGPACLPAHDAAARWLVGIVAVDPLPGGSRRFAVLASLHLLALNGLDARLDPTEVRTVLAGTLEVEKVATWLDPLVTARDPLEGELRALLAPDAWRAIGRAVFRAYRHDRRLATAGDLLMGVFREASGPAAVALGADGASTEPPPPHPPPSLPGRIPAFEPEVRKVLELGFRASVVLGHREINTGHLLMGLLDGGHHAVLPEGLSPDLVRQQVVQLLGAAEPDEGDLTGRLTRLAARVRRIDPDAAAELDEVADLQRIGLDRLVEMVRAWRGDVFLEGLAREPVVVRLIGASRLGAAAKDATGDELLAKYVADIAQYPSLSRTEEEGLARSMRTEAAGPAWRSQRRLIQSSLRLVVRIARTYETSGMSMLDLIQEGNLGLLKASETFDPTKGYRFGAYATWWIRKSIVEAIARGGSG